MYGSHSTRPPPKGGGQKPIGQIDILHNLICMTSLQQNCHACSETLNSSCLPSMNVQTAIQETWSASLFSIDRNLHSENAPLPAPTSRLTIQETLRSLFNGGLTDPFYEFPAATQRFTLQDTLATRLTELLQPQEIFKHSSCKLIFDAAQELPDKYTSNTFPCNHCDNLGGFWLFSVYVPLHKSFPLLKSTATMLYRLRLLTDYNSNSIHPFLSCFFVFCVFSIF